MSVYQQGYYSAPPGYGAPHSYYPPPPAPAPAPAVPVYLMDPDMFRREYSARLADLTVNSRPIIQNLSMLAHEYSRYSDIVADCLQAHIRRVPPWIKLPAFYLLDMISKNIYDVYARRFASFIVPLFLESYHAVDQQTRSKMEELALTWRTGSPTRKELFGVASQVAIERGIWGDGSSSSVRSSSAPARRTRLSPRKASLSRRQGQVSQAQVLSELEFTLGQKERALQSNPFDAISQQHITVLQQLRRVVETGVSQTELQQILQQLRTLVQHANPPPPPPPVSQPAHTWTAPVASYPPSSSRSVYPAPESVPIQAPAPTVSSQVPAVGPDFSFLLSTLVRSGLVSQTGTPVGASASTTFMTEPSEIKTSEFDLELVAERAYRDSILSHDIHFSTSGITRSTPAIHDLLYASDSIQCKQCGLRYPDTLLGKKAQQEHLDMHFRQNRKVNENLGRGHSRCWFVTVEDWIHDTADVKGKGRDSSRRLSASAQAAAESSKRDAELRASFVIVPPGDEAKPIACPICKETLKSEFVEDDEDWVWKNAVTKDGRIYHATCLAETATNSLATRLRSEQSRSRSGTPDSLMKEGTPPPLLTVKSPSPSPDSKVAGVKRKMEDDYSHLSDGSPPIKRLALTPA